MDLLSTGDGSGRPDTAGVSPELAWEYAQRMFDAVVFVRFSECQRIHHELNADAALYTLANDKFKALCKQRGVSRGGELWREYCDD
jgi:hypothetical protein